MKNMLAMGVSGGPMGKNKHGYAAVSNMLQGHASWCSSSSFWHTTLPWFLGSLKCSVWRIVQTGFGSQGTQHWRLGQLRSLRRSHGVSIAYYDLGICIEVLRNIQPCVLQGHIFFKQDEAHEPECRHVC